MYVRAPYSDKPVHIHRVLSSLNLCLRRQRKLSKDRLLRINMAEAQAEFGLHPLTAPCPAGHGLLPVQAADGPPHTDSVGLGSDVVFLFCTPIIGGHGKFQVRFWIGRVARIVRGAAGSRRTLLTQEIYLAKLKDGSSPNVFFICSWFKPCNADYRASLQYTFEAGPHELTAVAGECALVEVPRSHARPRCSPT